MEATAVPRIAAVAALFLLLLAACEGEDAGSPVTAPGAEESGTTKALDAGAVLLQDKRPIEALNAYLNGFHFYNGNLRGQMEAHHYCSMLNEEVTQCVIYDGSAADAKIMGVEYVVSERLFRTLPDEEKALWHSHVHEVKSGQLVAPGIPDTAEQALMKKLVGTYGKTWHTWHTDLGKELPIGVPQLMMGFTADGQADADMVSRRDQRLGILSEDRRKLRADIPAPPVAEGADAWQHGRTIQIDDPAGAGHSHPQGHTPAPKSP